MRKIRIVAILILCFILTTGMNQKRFGSKIDGFLGFAWKVSFDRVMDYFEGEIESGEAYAVVVDEENKEEHNGIKDPTDYYICFNDADIQGYDAIASMGFGEMGLISGNYSFPSISIESDVAQMYGRLSESYRLEYGDPIQKGEGKEGYGAIWMDFDKNILLMIANDTEYYKKLEIEYMAAVNPMFGWLDSEIADQWEEDYGINFDKVLAYDPSNPHNPFQPRKKETEKYDGPYAYKVGDTTIYTEHDLEQWIVLDDRFTTESYTLDLDAMLVDLWCKGNRGGIFENKVGYSYVIDSENTKGLWFDSPDIEREKLYHAATVLYYVDGAGYEITIRMYDCDSSEPARDYYRVLSTYAIHKELAPLILYTIEQMEVDPRSATLEDLDLGRNFYCD